MRRVAAIAALALVSLACARRPAPVDAPGSLPDFARAPVDTIVLVRTRCFGRCPAYELVIPRGGAPRLDGDRERAAGLVTMVPDAVMDSLGRQALAGGFFALPPSTSGDPTLCPLRATDHPSVTVRLVQGTHRTEVVHYTGCFVSADPRRRAPPAEALMALADAIDAAAGIAPSR